MNASVPLCVENWPFWLDQLKVAVTNTLPFLQPQSSLLLRGYFVDKGRLLLL